MAFRKGVRAVRGVTLGTEFFSLFFPHLLEPAVIQVFGQFFRGFFRGVEQEKENGATGEDEGDIPAFHGAILADEMGLGKTLTAISIMFAFCKGGRSKAIVVAPSGVVR